MFTVYLSVPLITPPVSVVPVIDGQPISLNISVDVSIIFTNKESIIPMGSSALW